MQERFNFKRALCFIVSLITVSLFSVPAFAECNHKWEEYDWFCEEASGDRHVLITKYRCTNCDAMKEEKKYEKHDWCTTSEFENASQYSENQHKVIRDYECYTCRAEKRDVVSYENHDFRYNFRYNGCKVCGYKPVAKSPILLSAGKWTSSNEDIWLRINVPKAGYITIDTDGPELTDEDERNEYEWYDSLDVRWSLYNSAMKLYKGSKNLWGKASVPVKKGTYYVKLNDYGKVKYSFTKDPSKKNYSKKKAVKLKKKKKAVTVLFSNAKKKTWKRYYKIKLTKKQYLHINIREGYLSPTNNNKIERETTVTFISTGKRDTLLKEIDFGLRVTNSINEKVPIRVDSYSKVSSHIISSKKLEKGTYYICLSDNWSKAAKARSTGLVYSLSWN